MTPPPIVITPFNSRQMQLPQSPDSPCAERPPRLSRASTGTPSPLASPSFPYPLSPVSPALSDVTVVDMFSPALDHQCRDEDDLAKCSAKDSVQRGGYVKLSLEDLDPNEKLRQMDARMQQRTAHPRTALLALAICLTFAIGFGLGQGSAAEIRTEFALPITEVPCDPYAQLGVLRVNLTEASENRWEPLDAPTCQPTDYMTLIRQSQLAPSADAPPSELKFARGRMVVIVGDSVDRDHLEHFCYFASGHFEMISDQHPLSPPYPLGQAVPPEDYVSPLTGDRAWSNYDASRPHLCTVASLNLKLVNIFSYGFREFDEWIRVHTHYYPPAKIEDRIDQILIPLLANLAAASNSSSAVPDLVSLSPTFWGIYRRAVEDDQTEAGEVFRTMPVETRDWYWTRIEAVLRKLGGLWEAGEGQKAPGLLLRSLHHVKDLHEIPYERVQSLDSIARAVVLRLQRENEDVGRRLKVDDWGAKMNGMERYFKDLIHPAPLPGSYLYGNMLMAELKRVVES